MTNFTAADFSAVQHRPSRILLLISQRVLRAGRRHPWIVRIAFGALGLGIIASMFGDHAPDPNRCDPGSSAPFALTQTATPSTFTLGCPPSGVTYSIR